MTRGQATQNKQDRQKQDFFWQKTRIDHLCRHGVVWRIAYPKSRPKFCDIR